MQSVLTVASFFLGSMAFGTYAFTFLADTKQTGGGLLKIISALGIGAGVMGIIAEVNSSEANNIILSLFAVGALNMVLSLMHFHKNDERKFLGKFVLALNFFIVSAFCLLLSEGNFWIFSFLFSSVLFIGVVNYLMVLGHWYLVTPKMSVKPLLDGMKIVWLCMAIKLMFSVYGTIVAKEYFELNTLLGDGYSFNVMMVFARYAIGYLTIGIVSYFAWRLTKMRDTQGATGIFYVMVILMFMGELFGGYMFFEYGVRI